MKVRRRSKAAVVAGVAAALLLSACGAAQSPSTAAHRAPQNQSILTISIISTGVSKIPAYTTTGEDVQVINQVYGSLLQIKPGTSELVPSMATRYTVSPDGKIWTFYLRKGIQWQYGYGAFTCADVAFTWNFNKNPADHSFWQNEASTVANVDCPGPYVAVFHLKAPNAGFGWDVANIEPSTGYIMSAKAWNKLGQAGYNKQPVGTGPFELQSLQPNQQIVLVRNPNYFGQKAHVAKVIFKVISDNQTAALAVKTGSLDIAAIDPVTAAPYVHASGVHILVMPAIFPDWLEINTKVPPFNNLLVREAMRYAIDYNAIRQDVFHGDAGGVYQGLILKGQIGFDPAVNPQNQYDPTKARQLLKQAHVKLPISGFFTTYNDTQDINVGQLVQEDLAQVGINLQSRPLERGTLDQVRIEPTTPATIFGASLSPDPDFLLSLSLISSSIPPAGLNTARYHGIDTLYQEQLQAPTQSARLPYLRQIQQRLAADVPAIEVDNQYDVFIVSSKVSHYIPTVFFSGDPLNLITVAK